MSKKERRIKDLERTLRESVARNAIVSRENRELWAAYEAVKGDGGELQRQYDMRGEYVAYLEGQVDDLIATVRHIEGRVDSLSHDLGECQAGRAVLVKRLQNIQRLLHTVDVVDELRAENAELKSKIKAITTAAVDLAEHGSALIAELVDGDEG